MISRTLLLASTLSAASLLDVLPACAAEHGMAAVYSYRGGRTASGELRKPIPDLSDAV